MMSFKYAKKTIVIPNMLQPAPASRIRYRVDSRVRAVRRHCSYKGSFTEGFGLCHRLANLPVVKKKY